MQWLLISATGAARRSPVCKGSFKLQCETNLHPDLLGDLQSASRAVALRDLQPAGASTVLRGSLNCSAVLETAALQALRKLENCSVHLRFRCLCSLLHIWICLEEEQSSCTEKPLDCSALVQKAALQALRKLENCSVHRAFCGLPIYLTAVLQLFCATPLCSSGSSANSSKACRTSAWQFA